MQYLLGTTTFRKEKCVDKYANSVRVNKHEASSPRITMLCLRNVIATLNNGYSETFRFRGITLKLAEIRSCVSVIFVVLATVGTEETARDFFTNVTISFLSVGRFYQH